MANKFTDVLSLTPSLLTTNEIPECIDLAIESFDEYNDYPDHIVKWFNNRINHNPWQKTLPGIGVGIRDKDKLIAFRAMCAQPWWINGKSTIIAFGANTAVDSNYRGQGIASLLIKNSRGFNTITGSTTAGLITQRIFKKLEFQEVGGKDNDFHIARCSFYDSSVKRFGKNLGRIIGNLADITVLLRSFRIKPKENFYLQDFTRCNEEFDELWSLSKITFDACLERSSQFLNWRIFDAPTCPLEISGLIDGSGKLRAFGIWHTTTFTDNVRMIHLRDLFCPANEETIIQAILYLLFEKWRNQGISWVSFELASPQLTKLFKANGYSWIPSKGNRYFIHSNPPLDKKALDCWYRSGLDGDYFDLPFS